MGSKQEQLKSVLTDAIVELCRKEAFYAEELRIEGTVCLVSDRSSVLIAQITEQIGERFDSPGSDSNGQLPVLNTDQADEILDIKHKHLDETGSDLKRGILAVEYCREMSPPPKQFKHSPPGVQNKEKIEGKFKCPFCTKRYRFRQSLKDHMNKHTGRKPHVCKYCSHAFMHFGSLCAHIKKQHFSQMTQDFQCGVCKDYFLNEQSLKQHFTWRHQDIPYVGPTRKTPLKTSKNQSGDTKPTADDAPVSNNTAPPAPPGSSLPQHNPPLEGAMNLDQLTQTQRKAKPDVADMVQTYMQLMDATQSSHPPASYGSPLLNNLPGLRSGPPPPLPGLVGLGSTAGLGGSAAAALGSLPSASGGSVPLSNQLGNPLPPFPHFTQFQNSPASVGLAQLQLEMAARHMPLPLNLQPITSLPEQSLPVMTSPPPPPSMTSLPVMTSASNPTVTSSVAPSPSPVAMAPSSTSPSSSDCVAPKTEVDLEIQRTSDGKFRCPYCEKMYNFKHTLKDHINKHTGKRPYVCKHCGDSFTHLASLCAHIKRRHDAEITTDYQCEVCQEKFMNLQSLKQHYTWRHKDLKFPIAKYEGPGLLELSTEISNTDVQPTVFPENGGSRWIQGGAAFSRQ